MAKRSTTRGAIKNIKPMSKKAWILCGVSAAVLIAVIFIVVFGFIL